MGIAPELDVVVERRGNGFRRPDRSAIGQDDDAEIQRGHHGVVGACSHEKGAGMADDHPA